MEAALKTSTNLYWYQAEAMFKVMMTRHWTPGSSPSFDIDPEHGKYALWLTYQMIREHSQGNDSILDKKLLYSMRRKFDITSQVTNLCIKALETVFQTLDVIQFTNNRNKRNNSEKCKRYSINDNNGLISEWCKNYEEKNPDVKLMLNVLHVVH